MMLKEKKIDFQRSCEEYIEEQGLYEIFEDMMRSLIVNKPDDPVKFLIEKLEKPESKCQQAQFRFVKKSKSLKIAQHLFNGFGFLFLSATRIVLVGPPGSKRKEIALCLTSFFSEEGKDFQCISVGDLITRQITQKNQQYGENIERSLETYSYVKDEIVIKLVKQQIELMEQHQKSWIIEGFPRTEAQAIAL